MGDTMIQLSFSWDQDHVTKREDAPVQASGAPVLSNSLDAPLAPIVPATSDGIEVAACLPAVSQLDDLPVCSPLPAAVEAGVFGLTEAGPIEPDAEEVASITTEHAHEMTALLIELAAVEASLRSGCDPGTGRPPRTEQGRTRLMERLEAKRPRLQQSYADAVAAFAEAFGDQAASALDAWVRKVAASAGASAGPTHGSYPPTHPWHYYDAGDNAIPIPVDEIPADETAGEFLLRDLPKNPTKRPAKLRELAVHEREQLEADRKRYADIAERGAEALSRYDREIAHTSDAMARATALALKYTHVSLGQGRVAWIENELRRLGAGVSLEDAHASKTTKCGNSRKGLR